MCEPCTKQARLASVVEVSLYEVDKFLYTACIPR